MMMSKEIGELSLKLTVEDVKPVVMEAMSEIKDDFIEWREIMTVHGYHSRAIQIQKYIDAITEAEDGASN